MVNDYYKAVREAANSNLTGDALRKRAAEICQQYGAHSVSNVMLAIDITRHPGHFEILVGGLPQVNAPGL